MSIICLCMIVKNEEKIIIRCLDSVINYIDYLFIMDTGSNDSTIELINEWSIKKKIKYKIVQELFIDFGTTRTNCLNQAYYFMNYLLDNTYFLLLDADMILNLNSNFNKKFYDKDMYHILQKNSILKYWNIRLLSGKLKWKCVGTTHEYWIIDDSRNNLVSSERIYDIFIDDRDDGGCKSNKSERDILLLYKGIENTEDSFLKARYYFYLGLTYQYIKKYKKSIKYFNLRLQFCFNPEERFYSYFSIGKCFESLSWKYYNKSKDIQIINSTFLQAHRYYLLSWKLRPSRREPIYYLLNMYKRLNKSDFVKYYKNILDSIPYPNYDNLFIEYNIYN